MQRHFLSVTWNGALLMAQRIRRVGDQGLAGEYTEQYSVSTALADLDMISVQLLTDSSETIVWQGNPTPPPPSSFHTPCQCGMVIKLKTSPGTGPCLATPAVLSLCYPCCGPLAALPLRLSCWATPAMISLSYCSSKGPSELPLLHCTFCAALLR